MTTNTTTQRAFSEAGALLRLGLPIVATQLAQAAMGLTDTLMAGRYGADDLAGVAIGTSLWHPLILLFVGILMAAVPLVAHAFGADDRPRVSATLQQGLWLALALALAGILLLGLAPQIYALLDVEPAMGHVAEGYIDALRWGLPAVTLYTLLRCGFEALHQTRLVMLIALAGVVLNIPLNYVLIFGKLGFPELGGIGCGIATTISLWFQLLLAVWLSIRHPLFAPLALWQRFPKPDPAQLAEYLRIGTPIGLAIFIEASMFLLIALLLTPFGSAVVSGHQIAFTTVSTSFMIPLSLSMALSIRVGFRLGQRDPRAARRSAQTGIALGSLVALISASTLWLAAVPIARLYSTEDEVIELAITLLQLGALFQISDVMQVCAAGALRGYRDTRFPLFGALIAYWLIGLPLGYLLCRTELIMPSLGAAGFWIGLITGLSIAAVMLLLRLAHTTRKALAA